MSASRILGLMIVSSWLAVGCSSAKKIQPGATCILNTDCNNPLVCSMDKCHDACHATADCPAGENCVKTDKGTVCQLPAEATCAQTMVCSGTLVCASDLRCRAGCLSPADCAEKQVCVTGVCADTTEINTSGQLPQLAPDGGADTSAPDGGGQGSGADLAVGAGDVRDRDAGVIDLANLAPDAPRSSQPEAGAGTGSDGKTGDGGGATVACNGRTLPTASGSLTVGADNYLVQGTLHGYATSWVGQSSVAATCVTPSCGDPWSCTPNLGPGTALCAAGTVAKDSTYVSSAGLSFSVNQGELATGDITMYAIPAPTSITASYVNPGGSPIRVVLQNWSANASWPAYCVESGRFQSGQPIPITSFNTACWDNSGAFLSVGTPINGISLSVPSSNTVDTPFAFCLTGVTMTGSAVPDAGASDLSPATPDTSAPAPDTAAPDLLAQTPDTANLPEGGGGPPVATGCGVTPTSTRYFCDDFESGLSKWLVSGQDWNTTTSTSRSPSHCATDSPDGNYSQGAATAMTMANSLDLADAISPILTFWQKLTLRSEWYTADHVYVEVSSDSGTTWSQLVVMGSVQNTTTWSLQQLSLSAYVGKKIRLRFRLADYNDGNEADGWYIDDVEIREAN